jgi:hypothetical protein
VYGHSNGPKRHFCSYLAMLLVHIKPWVNGHALGRAFASAAGPKVPPRAVLTTFWSVWSLQQSKMLLLQLPSYAFGTYKALGKRACAREGNGSGGQTKSAPARHYNHILECLVPPKSYRQLLQLNGYAFATYKALGKRASAREGICVGGKTKSASSPARIT